MDNLNYTSMAVILEQQVSYLKTKTGREDIQVFMRAVSLNWPIWDNVISFLGATPATMKLLDAFDSYIDLKEKHITRSYESDYTRRSANFHKALCSHHVYESLIAAVSNLKHTMLVLSDEKLSFGYLHDHKQQEKTADPVTYLKDAKKLKPFESTARDLEKVLRMT